MQRIKTVESLARLAAKKKAVWYKNLGRPVPAIVVLNMPASVVLGMIAHGMTVYQSNVGRKGVFNTHE